MDQIFKGIIAIGNSLALLFFIYYFPYILRHIKSKIDEIDRRTKLADLKINAIYIDSLVRLERVLIEQEQYEQAGEIHEQIQSFLKATKEQTQNRSKGIS